MPGSGIDSHGVRELGRFQAALKDRWPTRKKPPADPA